MNPHIAGYLVTLILLLVILSGFLKIRDWYIRRKSDGACIVEVSDDKCVTISQLVRSEK